MTKRNRAVRPGLGVQRLRKICRSEASEIHRGFYTIAGIQTVDGISFPIARALDNDVGDCYAERQQETLPLIVSGDLPTADLGAERRTS